MKLKEYLILAGALLSLIMAYLYYRLKVKLGDLEADKLSREQRAKIDTKKLEAKEARHDYKEAIDRFNDLLKRYRGKR